jgi:hypothetical protein
MHFGSRMIEQIQQKSGKLPCNFLGCTASEIMTLMTKQNVSDLPLIYREYLEVFGQEECNAIFTGIDATYNYLVDMKKTAVELIDNFGDGLFELPDDAFVFAMIQGTDFWYFRTQPLENNPQVLLYLEGEGTAQPVGDLETFLIHLI